jgi:hypothetical protein
MTPLSLVPVPPQLLDAVGYQGDAKLVSLNWTPLGDTVWYDDGRSSGTGYAWAFLVWKRHKKVALHLAPFVLGSSDMEGTHRLLLDREARTVCVGTTAEVRAALAGQWPAEEPVELTREEMERVVEHVRRTLAARPLPTAAQLMASMRLHSALIAAMVRWLDEWVPEQEDKR